MTTERIIGHFEPRAKSEVIQEVRIGLGYTGVLLESGSMGIAYSFLDASAKTCGLIDLDRSFAGLKAFTLLEYLQKNSNIHRALGLATANALSGIEQKNGIMGNVIDFLCLKKEDRVGMIGYFGPLVEKIRNNSRELKIFELDCSKGPDLNPSNAAHDYLASSCDIAIITSTSIVNGTLDSFLASAKNCKEVILLGASTPIIPEIFKETPVTLLSGCYVKQPSKLFNVISEARGMKFFEPFIKKINVPAIKK